MKITKYVSDWLARAADDIQSAEILLKEEGPPNPICFHSQQAAEKYLKGYLAFQGQHVRKMHDLELLLSACQEIHPAFSSLKEAAIYLTKFYIQARYPADLPEFSMEEAKKALEAAKKVESFVLEKIKP